MSIQLTQVILTYAKKSTIYVIKSNKTEMRRQNCDDSIYLIYFSEVYVIKLINSMWMFTNLFKIH